MGNTDGSAATVWGAGESATMLAPRTGMAQPPRRVARSRRIRFMVQGSELTGPIDRHLYFQTWYVHVKGTPSVRFDDPQARNLSLAIIEARWLGGDAWISTERDAPAGGWPD